MEKVTIEIEISKHSLKPTRIDDTKKTYSMIPKIHIGNAKDGANNYTLSSTWNQDAIIISKEGADEEYLVSFKQFMEALDKAELI